MATITISNNVTGFTPTFPKLWLEWPLLSDLYKPLTILLLWRYVSFFRRACAHQPPYYQNKHRPLRFYFLSLTFGTKTHSWGWMFYVGFQRSNGTIRSTFFKHHFTFEDFIVFSPVFCQLIAGFAYISSVFFISCEWKVYYFQLPKVFPATVAKVKHNLEKTLFWSVLGSSNLKTCIRTAFEGRFLK